MYTCLGILGACVLIVAANTSAVARLERKVQFLNTDMFELRVNQREERHLREQLETRVSQHLTESSDSSIKVVSNVAADNSEFIRELQVVKADNSQFRRELDTVKADNSQFKRELDTVKADNSQFTRELETVKADNSQISLELETVKAALAHEQLKYIGLETKLETVQSADLLKTASMAELENKLKTSVSLNHSYSNAAKSNVCRKAPQTQGGETSNASSRNASSV
jgi:chromosome segregation ATPase